MDGDLHCWGAIVVDRTVLSKPVAVISSGLNHICAIDIDDDIHCWGQNDRNQIQLPENVRNFDFRTLAAGDFHTCALLVNNRTLCWGDNTDGQLETGSLP